MWFAATTGKSLHLGRDLISTHRTLLISTLIAFSDKVLNQCLDPSI